MILVGIFIFWGFLYFDDLLNVCWLLLLSGRNFDVIWEKKTLNCSGSCPEGELVVAAPFWAISQEIRSVIALTLSYNFTAILNFHLYWDKMRSVGFSKAFFRLKILIFFLKFIENWQKSAIKPKLFQNLKILEFSSPFYL